MEKGIPPLPPKIVTHSGAALGTVKVVLNALLGLTVRQVFSYAGL
jgi:hypothetical protein